MWDDRPFTLRALRMLPYRRPDPDDGDVPYGWPVEFAVFGNNLERPRYGPNGSNGTGPWEHSWIYNAFSRLWHGKCRGSQYRDDEYSCILFDKEEDAMLAYMTFSSGVDIEG